MAERKTNGQFAKGVSGNPGGKPAGLADMMALYRAETDDTLEVLKRIRDSAKAPAQARVAACQQILDRGWGKPGQSINMNHTHDDLESVLQAVNGSSRGLPTEQLN
jgi:hypothetical protein